MRKILMLSLAAMVALVACEKEEVKKPGQNTDEPAAEDTVKPFTVAYSQNAGGRTANVELFIDLQTKSLQAVGVDRSRQLVYTMTNQNDVMKTYGFNRQYLKEVVKPHTGHNNDMCVVGDKIWIPDGDKIYQYDLNTNKISMTIDVTPNIESGAKRGMLAICDYDSSHLLTVSIDQKATADTPNDPDDKMYVYKVNKATGKINQLFTIPWQGVYVQGATYANGYLFVATGQQKTYHSGASVWVIDMARKTLVDQMVMSFDGEAEGLDHNIEDGKLFLYMGIGNPKGKFAYVSRFISLYQQL